MIFINKPSKDPKDPYGYRPISLLNILGNILEKIIAQSYLHFLEYHNILADLQFGFRKGRSTQHPIFLLHNAIIHYSKNKFLIITSTRDVQKAFDTVWWRGLLHKLFHLPGDQLQFASLMYNYLSRRTVEPKFQGETAPQFHPKAGVPQGSSLGPILYLAYVNDIPDSLYADTIISRFSDDVVHIIVSDIPKNAHRSIHVTNIIEKTVGELQRIQKWEQDWKIKSNLSKSEIQIQGVLPRTLMGAGGITINNQSIPIKDTVRILGYNQTRSNISTGHIASLVTKATWQLQRLYRFRSVPSKVKLYLYKALIRPLIEYPAVLLADSSEGQIKRLQVVQNKALRFVYDIRWPVTASNDSLHQRANIPDIKSRLEHLQARIFCKLQAKYLEKDSYVTVYKYSDFTIEEESVFEQRNTMKLLLQKFNLVQRFNNPGEPA